MLRKFVLISTVFFTFFPLVCFSSEQRMLPIVSNELLKHADLETVWQSNLALSEGENVAELFLRGDYVYVLTDRNYLFCLNKLSGKLQFGKRLAKVGFPVFAPVVYDGQLIIVAGNDLIRMDAGTGVLVKSRRLWFNASGSAVRNSLGFYIPSHDKSLHVIDASDDLELFKVDAANESMITSVIASHNYVVFATSMGNVLSILPDESRLRWRFDAVKEIAAPLVMDGRWLYVSSTDTNLYKIDAYNGKAAWRFESGGMLLRPAFVSGDMVYQVIHERKVVALDKESGEVIWELEGGLGVLMDSDGRAYVMTDAGTMTVMNNKNSRKLYEVNFGGVEKFVRNHVDSKIYIGDRGGRVSCIKPVE